MAELNTKYEDELSKPITALQANNKKVIVGTLIQANAIYLNPM